MKNVTIAMDEALLAQVRVRAAQQGKSVSAFLADIARERVQAGTSAQLAALSEFLDGAGLPGAASGWPGRAALYEERDDELLRRHQSPDLRG